METSLVYPKLARDNADLSENGELIYHDYGFERKHIISVTTKDSKFREENNLLKVILQITEINFKERDIEGVLNFDNYNSIKVYLLRTF